MIKQIQKYGNSYVIRLDKTDLKFLKLKEDDWIDVNITKVVEVKRK